MDYLDLGIHFSNLKSLLARSACRMQMQWEIRPVFSIQLCCVMLLIVGERKQLNEENPIRGPEIRRVRRAQCSHEASEPTGGVITMPTRDLLSPRLQTFNLNLYKHKKIVQKATEKQQKFVSDVLVSSVMLTYLHHKTSIYVAPNISLISSH